MGKIQKVLQTPTFKKATKKLKPNQKQDLDDAIKSLIEEPLLGQQKKGDLAYLRVFKFKMVNQLTLLGYSYVDGVVILELLNIGSHENSYRDMKRN